MHSHRISALCASCQHLFTNRYNTYNLVADQAIFHQEDFAYPLCVLVGLQIVRTNCISVVCVSAQCRSDISQSCMHMCCLTTAPRVLHKSETFSYPVMWALLGLICRHLPLVVTLPCPQRISTRTTFKIPNVHISVQHSTVLNTFALQCGLMGTCMIMPENGTAPCVRMVDGTEKVMLVNTSALKRTKPRLSI